jgi:hypothetical protein
MEPVSAVATKIVLDRLWESIQDYGLKKMSHIADAALDDAVERLVDLFGANRPTTALIGFGHCGKQILWQLADDFAALEANANDKDDGRQGVLQSIRRVLSSGRPEIEIRNLKPLIVVGDLDESNHKAVKRSYSLYRDLGLKLLAVAGTGNMPAKAQFLARVALKASKLPTEGGYPWQNVKAGIIDSLGSDVRNRLRLVVYVFSTGGGSGSGFLYEIAQAQRFKQIERLASPTPPTGEETPDVAFTLGAAIMPGISPTVDAQSLNTGRVLCRYLADRWGASGSGDIWSIPAYHSIVLFSNGSFQSDEILDRQIKDANEFIASQLLTAVFAQDASKEADKKQKAASSQDQIRLDPSDLRNAICGVSLVGFYEQADLTEVGRALVLALGKPRRAGSKFVGMSVDAGTFGIVDEFESDKIGLDAAMARLSVLPVFKYCPGVTVVVAGPAAGMRGQLENDLKRCLAMLFPNARVRRHAVIDGEPSVTIYLSESGIFTEEAQRHLGNFIYNCFLDESGTETREIENLTTVIGGECKPLSIAEADVFLSNVAAKLDVKAIGKGLVDVLLSLSQANHCLEYMKKLQGLKGLKDGLPALEQWLADGSGVFQNLSRSRPIPPGS